MECHTRMMSSDDEGERREFSWVKETSVLQKEARGSWSAATLGSDAVRRQHRPTTEAANAVMRPRCEVSSLPRRTEQW